MFIIANLPHLERRNDVGNFSHNLVEMIGLMSSTAPGLESVVQRILSRLDGAHCAYSHPDLNVPSHSFVTGDAEVRRCGYENTLWTTTRGGSGSGSGILGVSAPSDGQWQLFFGAGHRA